MEKDEDKEEKGWDIFDVWKEYEKTAMHFNDLGI